MDGFKKLHEDLEKVIEKDDSNSSTTTSEMEDPKHSKQTFRQKLRHILHTNKFQIGVICLVILDCLLVIAELLIDLEVFEIGEAKDELGPAKVLHYMSITILSIFLIEIFTKIFAMGLDYFKNKLEVFDGIVVVVSFVLDVVFANQEGAYGGIGLLIVLRLWRVTRILNGIIMSVKKQSEKRCLRERMLKEAAEQELAKFREYCAAQEKEIEELQALLKKHGIDFPKIEKPVEVSTISVTAEVNEVDGYTKRPDDSNA
ncbi:voltage-gated hydrogen channel 1 [Lingula anatina]|uniref:Voltage-gated hydrogen channel 1 n=1 Tax=Lingula anatina TaxID=7574 RepID=A0A1S3JUF0_LINAN|nr:voltage-gated hydrogen channel 1 [Lingula anatina]XP_013413953.1 voltage-gated hydrogen channel 1 [Lingula anatina]|eukprot:XP_013413952.1 voltage-gated hydrogen channel 1 [Lingula anatina]